MEVERHVAGMVGEDCVGMRCHEVKESVCCAVGSFGGFGLLGGNAVESGKDGAVDGHGVET